MARITGREKRFDGKLLQLEIVTVEEDGKAMAREVVRHQPGAAIVVLQERGDEGAQGQQVIMARQFRPAVEEDVLEVIAGLVDEGETPLEAAQRELREEAGLEADSWDELGTLYTSPGFTDERITFFLAREVSYVGSEQDGTENLSIIAVPFSLALEQAMNGECKDLKSATGLFWAAAFLSNALDA